MATITLQDISLKNITFEDMPLLKKLREENLQTKPEVCIERARLITQYLKDKSSPDDSYSVRNAKAIAYYLENKSPLFFDDNLLAGSTTSKKFGAPVYPEFATGLTIWPELDVISDRKKNPLKLTKKEAETLNFEVYPYWMERSILEYTRKKHNNPHCMRLFERLVFYIAAKAGCISHTVPHYATALEHGLEYIISEAAAKEQHMAAITPQTDETKRKTDFYKSVQICLQGIIDYAANLSAKARECADKETDPARKDHFNKIAEACGHAPAKPARTFREAINAIWIIQVAIHAENINMAMSPGRLDQVLFPYYKKDIESGVLTIKEAMELIGCLWIKLNDNTNLVPETAEELFGGAGTVPAVTVGGITMDNEDAVNDLTYLMLRVTELLKLRDPNLNARYNYEKNTSAYRDRVAEVIANTKAIPAMHNDIADIKNLVNQGETLEHARDYAIIGCVELASNGRSYEASSSIILNLVSAFELTLYNGRRPITGDELITKETGDPATFTSYNQFWEAFKNQLTFLIGNAIELNEYFGHVYQEILPSPLLSAFFEGPMETGKDLIFGGAVYNSSGATHVGFSDVVDSLNAIEKAIFIDKAYTMADLIAALKNDFKNNNKMHAYLVHKTPKYGTDDPIARKNSQNLVKFLYDFYQQHTNYRNGKYRPAYWTMTNHAGQGRLCGALPSGRKNKKVLASGITPASQMPTNLTECFRNVAKVDEDNHHVPGGWALNLKYPLIETQDDIKKFGQAIEAYFREGGLQVQFNIRSYLDLIEARKNPEKIPDLIVRVSGYSAYFKDLNDAMKEEIITRSEYNLRTGEADSFPDEYKDMLPFE